MRLLLDTHAFIWFVSDRKKIPEDSINLIQENAGELYLSSITALEIALLVKRKRLKIPKNPGSYIEEAIQYHNLHEIPVDRKILLQSSALPEIHDDPFDRIIIATAKLHDLVLITKDTKIQAYPDITIVW